MSSVSMSDVIGFVRRHAPKGMGLWPDETISRFLAQRDDRNEVLLIRSNGRVSGLAVAQGSPGRIHIWAIIGSGHLETFVAALKSRWPDWASRRITAHRRGRFVTLTPNYFARITR